MNSPSNTIGNSKRVALEQRTLLFAANVRLFVRRLPRTISAADDVAQLLRSSGCVGSNYIEANEAPSGKEFTAHVRLCLKEAKEAVYWLKLLDLGNSSSGIKQMQTSLIDEGTQLLKIFFQILKKVRLEAAAPTAPETTCCHCSKAIETLAGQCPHCGNYNQCERCEGRIEEKTEGYYNARFCRDCEEKIVNAA